MDPLESLKKHAAGVMGGNVVVESEIEAIDFQKLWKEERRKARAAAKRQRQQQATAAVPTKKPTPPLLPWNGPTQMAIPLLDRETDRLTNEEHPPTVYYRPDFLPPSFGEVLWDWLRQLPKAESDENSKKEEPSTGCWHWLPHARRHVAVFTTIAGTNAPLPIQLLLDALIDAQVFSPEEPPNHVLINYYQAVDGILPHTDGPAYHDRTATISLGRGQVLLHMEPREAQQDGKSFTVLLHGSGSLVVFEDVVYREYLHSIREGVTEEPIVDCLNASPNVICAQRSERISLTFRRKKVKEEE